MANQITYRLAKDADINGINAFYNKIYKKKRTYEQFYWEFNTSPAGKAIYVIAEENGCIVGTQCAIPYYLITTKNEDILTAKSEDTLVSPDHRGKHIFENMYRLLIDECRKNRIAFIWGFTYADKPFKKLGFEIPFKSTMGLLTIKPLKAVRYFYSITGEKSFSSYLKILGLSYCSYLKYLWLSLWKEKKLNLSVEEHELNKIDFSYLEGVNYGIKLDCKFLDYRLHNNAYSSNYKCVSWIDDGVLKGMVHFLITKENIGFIIHLYIHKDLSQKESSRFLRNVFSQTSLKSTSVIRFWGFTHNSQNEKEVSLLRSNQFIFLKRGISFVGLHLDRNSSISFSNFVLSRMASQGTD